MTLKSANELRPSLDTRAPEQPEQAKPSFNDIFSAGVESSVLDSFRQNMSLDIANSRAEPVAGYNPYDADVTENEVYANFADAFINSQSPAETANIKADIDRRMRNRETLENGGLLGLATQIVTEPLNFVAIPGMMAATRGIASPLLRGAAIGAGSGGVGTAAIEAGLQASDPTRTAQESGLNILFGTVGGAALGTGIGGMARYLAGRTARAEGQTFNGIASEYTKQITDDLVGNPTADEVRTELGGGSLSAATPRNTTMQQETLVANRLSRPLQALEQTKGIANPVAQTMTSPSLASRNVVQELVEVPQFTNANMEGIASPVAAETMIRQLEAPLAQTSVFTQDAYIRMIRGRARQTGDMVYAAAERMAGRGNGRMSFTDFRKEVGIALRNGDQHTVPEVAEVAREWRKNVFDPLKERAIAAGILPPDVDVKTAVSYLTRVYNIPKIIARRNDFEAILTNALMRDQGGVKDYLVGVKENLQSNTSLRAQLAPDIERLKAELATLEPVAKRSRAQRRLYERELRVRESRINQLQTQIKNMETRVAEMKPTEKLPKDSDIYKQLKEIKTGRYSEPERLKDWVLRKGGIRPDSVGVENLYAVDIKPGMKGVAGRFYSNKGVSLDDLNTMAIEAGFIRGDEFGKGYIDDLVELLKEDFAGRSVYSEFDVEAATRFQQTQDLANEINRLGIDTNLSPEEILMRLEKGNEGAPGYKADTAFRRGKTAEAERAFARLEKMREQEVAALKKSQSLFDKYAKEASAAESGSKAQRTALDQAQSQLNTAQRRIENLQKQLDEMETFGRLDPADIKDIATQITETVIGNSQMRGMYQPIALTRGPLKERTLNFVMDNEIADFLESDIFDVGQIYNRTMSSDVVMTEKFGRADMQDQLAKVGDDYAVLREQATKTLKGAELEKELTRLQKSFERDKSNLEAMRDRLRGTYALPQTVTGMAATRIATQVKNVNFLSKMGGVVISSLADTSSHIFQRGLGGFTKDLVNLAKNREILKVAHEELKAVAAASEYINGGRLAAMSDISESYARQNKLERVTRTMTDSFGMVTGMSQWNTMQKLIGGLVGMSNMATWSKAIATGGQLPKRAIPTLANYGIDRAMAKRIAAQEQFWDKQGDLISFNTKEWTDREAAAAVQAALTKQDSIVIVQPGQEKPLIMSNPLGGVIFQFQSFAFSVLSRSTIRNLQLADRNTFEGMVTMLGFGMLTAYIKASLSTSSSQKKPEDWTPNDWIANGLDRSGMLGWLMTANNLVERGTGGNIGINPLLGSSRQTNRYIDRNITGSLLGPTFGTVQDVFTSAQGFGSGDPTQKDLNRMRRLLPYQNVFYMSWLFDQVEQGAGQAMGLRQTRN